MVKDSSLLETRVVGALLTNNRIGQALIEVENSDGVITLRGTVETEEDRWTAGAIVLAKEGVRGVVNELVVDRP